MKKTRSFGDWVALGIGGAMWALIILGVVTGWQWPRPVTLAVPMPGYGLPVCATEDSTPVGGCVWPSGDAVWINYPGRA